MVLAAFPNVICSFLHLLQRSLRNFDRGFMVSLLFAIVRNDGLFIRLVLGRLGGENVQAETVYTAAYPRDLKIRRIKKSYVVSRTNDTVGSMCISWYAAHRWKHYRTGCFTDMLHR